ncbi:MAG: S41 family peptidase [Candidatus Hodarchaeota archaeon]
MDPKINRDALIQDIRELTNILENAHPDPYIKGGGKIAYHRRLQKLIRDIPPEGMTKQDFLFYLQPFIAKVGDGHTAINLGTSPVDKKNPGGVPLYFDVIDEQLYVDAVANKEYLPLIGCRLVSIEDIAFNDLVKRHAKQGVYENIYHLLAKLGKIGSLVFKESLKNLIPEWKDPEQIRVVLRHPTGEERNHTFPPLATVTFPLLRPESKITFPENSNKFFSYHFIDSEKKIAFLQINSMSTYREAFEYWEADGMTSFNDWRGRLYQFLNNKPPPEDVQEILQGIPAATELFLSLVKEMKKENTKYLIVDLRQNEGGLDLMIQMLLYFLVGFDKTISLTMKNAEICKFSEYLHKSSKKGIDIENVHYRNLVPLTLNDYDFSHDPMFDSEALRKFIAEDCSSMFEKMPSFFKEFRSGEFEAHYLPEKIFVLCSNTTFSSGYNLMTAFYRLGALLVGTPSSQAGNSFGNCREFELPNSKVTGIYSTKYFVAFPDDPEKGQVLMPHYPLTYEKLALYEFDPNATVLYALDIIKKSEK